LPRHAEDREESARVNAWKSPSGNFPQEGILLWRDRRDRDGLQDVFQLIDTEGEGFAQERCAGRNVRQHVERLRVFLSHLQVIAPLFVDETFRSNAFFGHPKAVKKADVREILHERAEPRSERKDGELANCRTRATHCAQVLNVEV